MPRYIHSHSLVPWEWLCHATIYQSPVSRCMGVLISCHDISIPSVKLRGGDFIMPRYIHPLCLVVWEWLDIMQWHIFTPHTKFRVDYDMALYFHPDKISWGGVTSWHYIFTPHNIRWGVIKSWRHIFTPQEPGTGRWLYLDIFTPYIFDSAD